MIIEAKYLNFWPRFWAGFVDSLVLSPLIIADFYIKRHYTGGILLACDIIISYSCYYIYNVIMISRYGQTLGKMALNIRVMNVAEDRIPSLRQAILRDIGYIFAAVCGMVYSLYLVALHRYSLQMESDNLFLSVINWIMQAWFWIEVITMLSNNKRRALHDLIAGTVVVSTSVTSPTIGLGLNEPPPIPQTVTDTLHP